MRRGRSESTLPKRRLTARNGFGAPIAFTWKIVDPGQGKSEALTEGESSKETSKHGKRKGNGNGKGKGKSKGNGKGKRDPKFNAKADSKQLSNVNVTPHIENGRTEAQRKESGDRLSKPRPSSATVQRRQKQHLSKSATTESLHKGISSGLTPSHLSRTMVSFCALAFSVCGFSPSLHVVCSNTMCSLRQ